MKITAKGADHQLQVTYELNEQEIAILMYMKNVKNFVEWRNTFDGDDLDDTKQFKYSDFNDLIVHDFIAMVPGCWHLDYKLGWRGKAYLGLPFNIDTED